MGLRKSFLLILLLVLFLLISCSKETKKVDIPKTPSFGLTQKQGNIYVVFDLSENLPEAISKVVLELNDIKVWKGSEEYSISDKKSSIKEKTLLGYKLVSQQNYDAVSFQIKEVLVTIDGKDQKVIVPVQAIKIPVLFEVKDNLQTIIVAKLLSENSFNRVGSSELAFLPVFEVQVSNAQEVVVKSDTTFETVEKILISNEVVSVNLKGAIISGKVTQPLLIVKDGRVVETELVQDLPNMPQLLVEKPEKSTTVVMSEDEFKTSLYNGMLSPSQIVLPQENVHLRVKSRDDEYKLEITDLTAPFIIPANGDYILKLQLKEKKAYPVKCHSPCKGKILGYVIVK